MGDASPTQAENTVAPLAQEAPAPLAQGSREAAPTQAETTVTPLAQRAPVVGDVARCPRSQAGVKPSASTAFLDLPTTDPCAGKMDIVSGMWVFCNVCSKRIAMRPRRNLENTTAKRKIGFTLERWICHKACGQHAHIK